jgi:hypothetical protein
MVFDSADEDSTFLPIQDVPLAEFTQKAFPGFIHKTQYGAVCLLASMGGVVSLSPPLLIPVDGFRSGIDTEVDPPMLQPTQMPGSFPQNAAYPYDRVGLIDPEAVHVPPEGAGCRQAGELEESTNHGIQADIDKMPQPIETNEEQHQNPKHHPTVPQLGISARPPVSTVKNLFKTKQIHKLDQPQKPTKRAEPLCTSAIGCGSRDSAGPTGLFQETFTSAIFRGSIKSLVNHLGYLLSMNWISSNPIIIGNPDGFLFSSQPLGAKSRY